MKEIAASTDVPIEYMQASVRKQVFHSKDDIDEPMFLEEVRPMKFRIVYMRINKESRRHMIIK